MGHGVRGCSAGVAAFLAACATASATPTVTELTGGVTPGFSANSAPFEIIAGRYGGLWFTEATDPGQVARVNADASVTEFPLSGAPWGLAEGPDASIWVAESTDPGRIARVAFDGTVTELVGGVTPGFTADVVPRGVAMGPDGRAWFTEAEGGVARVNDDLSVSELLPGATPGFSADALPAEITTGPDGRLWFTDDSTPGRVSRINDDLSVTEFAAGIGGFTGASPFGITAGSDGAIWVTGLGAPGRLARTIGDGTFTELTGGITPGFSVDGEPLGITAGADRQMWFAAAADPGRLGRVNADGTVTELTGGLTPGFSANGGPSGIVTAPDGDLWFTEQGDPGRIGRLTPGPGASTGDAVGVESTSARVFGSVHAHRRASVFAFEYGTTTAYGAQTPSTGAGSSIAAKPVNAKISGLAPGTLYHYRLTAANDSDTTLGADRTFTTAPATPDVPVRAPAPTSTGLSRLAISPSTFRAAPKGASAQAATTRRHYGARVSFTLAAAASVRFTVVWLAPGRQASEHGGCAKPTRSNRKARACTRAVVLHGGFTRAGRQGNNALRFNGRLASHRLKPGRYELFATPSPSGRPRSVHFRIVR